MDGRDESLPKPPDPMMWKSNMPVPCLDGDEIIDSSESSESDRFRLSSILVRFLRRGLRLRATLQKNEHSPGKP